MPKLNSPIPFLTVTGIVLPLMITLYSPSMLANMLPSILESYTLSKTSMLNVTSALATLNGMLLMLFS